MIKPSILIVEDDPIISVALKKILQENNFEVIGVTNNASDAWGLCKKHLPQLVILDVYLEGDLTGIWVGEQIEKMDLDIKIIYLTAYDDDQTIRYIERTSPYFYLTKPFKESMLISNIKLALKTKKLPRKTVKLWENHKLYSLVVAHIYYIQSEGNYLNIYGNFEKSPIIVRKRLPEIIEMIPENEFIRVHQRYVVNRMWVDYVDLKHITINKELIPISRSFRKDVKNKLKGSS